MSELFHDRVALEVGPDHVATVTLARGDKLNAIDPAMFAGLAAVIAALRTRSDVRAVVLTGAGRAFCAGLDMASMMAGGGGVDLDTRDDDGANGVQAVAWGWRCLPMPVIAAGHGVIFGGGLQILSGADVIIVAPDARLAIMETRWGLVPDMAGWPLWRGRVRDDRLRLLATTHAEFSGEDAAAWGFATETADDPLARARAIAAAMAALSPAATRGVKRLANAAATTDDRALLALEAEVQRPLLGSPEQTEAVMAALAKRPAVFPPA